MTIFRLLNEKADIERIESCINNDPACVTSEIHSNSPGLSQMLSPLHVAVKRKRPDVVKLLLDKKADPNKQATRIYGTDANFTPLTMAAIQPGGIEILKLLLDNGGDPNAGFEFQEPLPQALLKTREESTQQDLTENIRLLLEYEGDPNCPLLNYRVENGVTIMEEYGDGEVTEPPLPVLLRRDNFKAAVALLQHGTKCVHEWKEKTPLNLAIEKLKYYFDRGTSLKQIHLILKIIHLIQEKGGIKLKDDFLVWSNYLDKEEIRDTLLAFRGQIYYTQGKIALALQDWLSIRNLSQLSVEQNFYIGDRVALQTRAASVYDINLLKKHALLHLEMVRKQGDPFAAQRVGFMLTGITNNMEFIMGDEWDYPEGTKTQNPNPRLTKFKEKLHAGDQAAFFEIKDRDEKHPTNAIDQQISKAQAAIDPRSQEVFRGVSQLELRAEKLRMLGWDEMNNCMKNLLNHIRDKQGFLSRRTSSYKNRCECFEAIYQFKLNCENAKSPGEFRDALKMMRDYVTEAISRFQEDQSFLDSLTEIKDQIKEFLGNPHLSLAANLQLNCPTFEF